MGVSNTEQSPLRSIVRRMETILAKSNLDGEGALEFQECIDDLMTLAKRYEPLSTREVNKV